jgi:hypothetical protein
MVHGVFGIVNQCWSFFWEGVEEMNSSVYCMYSTEDGVPRYVGLAADKVSYRFKQHVTAALEREPGALYEWMRDVWRSDFDVAVYTLQEGIIPKDEELFERYWIDQFSTLLNVHGIRPDKQESSIAKQLIAALRAQLELARKSESPIGE